MAQNQEIKVVFADDAIGQTSGDTHWNAPEQQHQTQGMLGSKTKQGALALGTIGYQLGITGLTTVAGRVGNYTGNVIAQNKLNNGMFAAQIAGTLVMAASGNPIPLIMTAFQTAVKASDYTMEMTKQNTATAALRDLVGTSATKRSRTPGSKI